MMTRTAALLIGSVLVSPAVIADERECYTSTQEVVGRDGRATTATLRTCRTETGGWETTPLPPGNADYDDSLSTARVEVVAARQELNAQLMENERLRDGRPKTEPTSPQAVCERPAPPPALPAMPEWEQLEAGSAELQSHITDIQSYLACLNGRIHATADPEARAVTRGQYYQAERHAIDLVRAMKARYDKYTERVGGDRAAPEPTSLQLWVPGQPHPAHANVVAAQVAGQWTPAPGYRWRNEKQMIVEWQQGLAHPLEATLIAGPSPGTWHVDDGTGMALTDRPVGEPAIPSVREAGEQGYCAALEQAIERVRTDFDRLKGEVVGTGLTVFDGRNSAHTKTMYTPTFDLHPGSCQVWDLDDPAYADEYACHWQAPSADELERTWQSLHGLVSACLAPEQYSCYTPPVRQNRRTICHTPRASGRPYLQWAQRAGNASGELVLYNDLTIAIAP